jgi:hypothetical protein
MKKIVILIIIALLSSFLVFGQNEEHYLTFLIKDRQELTKLTRIISIDNVKNLQVWAYANNAEFKSFLELGYKYTILPKSLQKGLVINMATTIAQMANWDKYPTYQVYVDMMKDYATRFPAICKLDTIAILPSGRAMLSLIISKNVNIEENEPEFFYTSSIHGDEVTGYVLMLRLIDYLLNNYSTNARVSNLVNNIKIYINPLANPDGTYAGGDANISGATRYNSKSVDINRNFPDARAGIHPDGNQWQTETQAMMDYAAKHYFILSANFHGGSEVLNYPWDTWTGGPPDNKKHPDDTWFSRICKNWADSAKKSNSNYLTDVTSSGYTNGGDWYVISGGRQDFMTYYHYDREVTIEISEVKTLSSDQLPTLWNYNKNCILAYMEECLYGIRGIVTDVKGKPLSCQISVAAHDADNSMVITDPAVGDYHRMIAAGTYNLTFIAPGYNTKTVNNVDVKDNQATTVNVSLTKSSGFIVTFHITSQKTNSILMGATVTFNSQTQITNSNGDVTFTNITAGNNMSCSVTMSGYKSNATYINVSTDQTFYIQLADVGAGIEDTTVKNILLYPNPFNDEMSINFEVPNPTMIQIEILDIVGKTVKLIKNGKMLGPQKFIWQGDNEQGNHVKPGLYFCKLTCGNCQINRKIVLLGN